MGGPDEPREAGGVGGGDGGVGGGVGGGRRGRAVQVAHAERGAQTKLAVGIEVLRGHFEVAARLEHE